MTQRTFHMAGRWPGKDQIILRNESFRVLLNNAVAGRIRHGIYLINMAKYKNWRI